MPPQPQPAPAGPEPQGSGPAAGATPPDPAPAVTDAVAQTLTDITADVEKGVEKLNLPGVTARVVAFVQVSTPAEPMVDPRSIKTDADEILRAKSPSAATVPAEPEPPKQKPPRRSISLELAEPQQSPAPPAAAEPRRSLDLEPLPQQPQPAPPPARGQVSMTHAEPKSDRTPADPRADADGGTGGQAGKWVPDQQDPEIGPRPRKPAPEKPRVRQARGSIAVGTPQAVPAVRQDGPAGAYVAPPVLLNPPHPATGELRGLPPEPEVRNDVLLQGADLAGLRVRAACLRGDDHRYAGTLRQDSMDLALVADGRALFLAVSDGVGNAKSSHLGSEIATRHLRDLVAGAAADLLAEPDPDAVKDRVARLVAQVATQITAEAERRRIDPAELSATLVAALVENTPPGPSGDTAPRRVVVFSVGDSCVLVLRDGAFEPIYDVKGDSDMANAPVRPLPGFPVPDTVLFPLAPGEVLVVGTDGLGDPMRDNDKVKRQLADWWGAGAPRTTLEFGWQVSFNARTYGDDRTAICVWGR